MDKSFNLLDYNQFSKLSVIEQHKCLIDSGIYIKGEKKSVDFDPYLEKFSRSSSNYPKYLGLDIVFENIRYKINEEFINSVFNACYDELKNVLSKIEDGLKTLELQLEFESKETIVEKIKNLKEDYKNKLHDKCFQDLHKNLNFEDIPLDILKNHLEINWFDLSDFLFGLNNIRQYDITSNYHSYIYLNKNIQFLNDNIILEKASTKDGSLGALSLPKKIALLNEIGFYQLDFFKSLKNDKQRHKFLAYLFDLDFSNPNTLRSIRGNYNTLNQNYNENPIKYTAWASTNAIVEEVKKLL